MSASDAFTLSKEERICSRKLIEKLFNGADSHSLSAFPLRVVYMTEESGDASEEISSVQAQMLVSVPKRYFKRAVKRNRVKRQVREAFRKNKSVVLSRLEPMPRKRVAMAFIWLDDKLRDSVFVEQRVQNLLSRIAERL
jgi:ribonuclease P protein component